MPIPALRPLPSLDRLEGADALVVVLPSPLGEHLGALGALGSHVRAQLTIDASLGGPGARPPQLIAAKDAPGGRLVVATLGKLDDETDDVRSVGEQAALAVGRAVEAGSANPALLVVTPGDARFAHARDVAALAALASQWVALEAREAGKAPRTAESIGVVGLDEARARALSAVELGRALARDITGTEPERMAPLRVAALCETAFAGTTTRLTVEDDVSTYPLLAAVARASMKVPRHRPCVVRLEHAPKGAKHTLLLAGKGVTYDTGGADLKTNGHMAGMSRDKGGAAAVAGLIRAVAALGLENVRVIGLLGCVRNSIGDDAFVSDEIIASRAGVRVRIGNTDAEGRLVLADLLAAAREQAEGAADPFVLSIATLTGHVYRAHGPYIGAIANAAARAPERLPRVAQLGELWGEPIEHTRPRREDYAFVAGRSATEDLVSCNRAASVDTPRGHQFPFAFLDVASGLKARGLPFAHVDIGGVAVSPADWQFGRPTATPITTLVEYLRELG